MAPRQNARKKGRTAKMGDDATAAKKKQKEQTKNVQGCVVSVSPELCLLEKRQTSSSRTLRQRERTPKKGKPDMKRIFIKLVRAPKAKKIKKHVGRTPPKTQNHNKTAKTKIRTRKWISNTSPEGKRKNGQKTLTNLQKQKTRKTDSISFLINEQSCQILSFVFACMYDPQTKTIKKAHQQQNQPQPNTNVDEKNQEREVTLGKLKRKVYGLSSMNVAKMKKH